MKRITLLILVTFIYSILIAQSEIFISEYVSGSGNNRAIELYNPSSNSINLGNGNYSLIRYSNGGTIPYSVSITGIVPAGGTYVVVVDKQNPNATGYDTIVDQALLLIADTFVCPVYNLNKMMYFNGNDAVALFKGNNMIDLVGKVGQDPGQAWTTDAANGYTSAGGAAWWTKRHTMIRKPNIATGISSNPSFFNPSIEWDTLPNNTFSNLGSHTTNYPSIVVSSNTISSSSNVYSYLVEQQSCLTANQSTGLISFTHRGKIGLNSCTNSGDIIVNQSRNYGSTWSELMAYPNNSTVGNNRYPSGVIYNPTGNTNPDNSFIVTAGPVHDGTDWNKAFIASMRMDSTNINRQYLTVSGALIRNGMVATSDGKVHLIGISYSQTTYTLDSIYLITGNFNSTTNSFNWAKSVFTTSFISKSNGADFAYMHFNTAWSENGSIGYYWAVGRDASNDTRTYQPIVWKTTNSGSTWTKMPVFNFASLTTITNELQPMKGVTPAASRPAFSDRLDGVVDVNGNLHLISHIKACSSNHNDSLGYTYFFASPNFSNPIFDVYTTSNGWAARLLGSAFTNDVGQTESGYGSIGWNLRLQAGKTADGTKIFASWTDSDTTTAPTGNNGLKINKYPNIFVAAWDINTSGQLAATNISAGIIGLQSSCYFHYMSDIILSNNNLYSIPLSKLNLGNTPSDPVDIKYISGVTFTDADFIINSQNNPYLTVTTNTSSICLGDSINLNVQVSNSSSYNNFTWSSNPSGFSANIVNPTVFPTVTSWYYCYANNSTNSNIATIIDSIHITVSPLPIISLTNNTSICNGANINLTVSSNNTNDTYLWNNGATTNSITVSPSTNSTYNVIVDNGTCNITDSVIITVIDLPIVNIGPDTNFKWTNGSVIINAGNNGASWLWSTGGTNQTETFNNTNLSLGANNVYVIVTKNGCSSNDTTIITVINDVSIENSLNKPEIILYPNPTVNIFNISIKDYSGDVKLEIFNSTGKIVSNYNYYSNNNKTESFDIKNLVKGVYYINIQTNKGNTTKQLIIQ